MMAVAMEDHAFWLSDVSPLEKVLKELTKGSQLSRLLEGVTEDTCILFLAVSYWITLCCPSGLCVPLQALTGVFVSANGKE